MARANTERFRAPVAGEVVTVHYNLQAAKRGEPAWAVTAKEGLIGYVETIQLEDVTPRYWLGDKGHGKVIRTNRRKVVAWLRGTVTKVAVMEGDGDEVAYNPFRSAEFHTRDGVAVTGAEVVTFGADGRAWAVGVRR
jgi:hypothetical protein